jgi:hypothetical protein
VPTFLSSPGALREAIRTITAPTSGKRVVVAAFVGRDALSFIPKPSGVRLYCWDNPLATHPDGIADLIANGAKVYFVKGLHAKVYWSSAGGVLVASSNVSANALDEDAAQLETGVLFANSAVVAIEKLHEKMRAIGVREVTPARLAAFRALYDRTPRPRGNAAPSAPPRTLAAYAGLPVGLRTPFKLSWYRDYGALVKKDLGPLVGRPGIVDYADAERMVDFAIDATQRLGEGDWALIFRCDGARVLQPHWMSVDRRAERYATGTHRWMAYQFRRPRRQPPFDCRGTAFRAALQRFVGSDVNLAGDEVTMTAGRVKKLLAALQRPATNS